VYVWCMCI